MPLLLYFVANPDPGIKKSKITVYLEKWREVEPPFVYG